MKVVKIFLAVWPGRQFLVVKNKLSTSIFCVIKEYSCMDGVNSLAIKQQEPGWAVIRKIPYFPFKQEEKTFISFALD